MYEKRRKKSVTLKIFIFTKHISRITRMYVYKKKKCEEYDMSAT